MGKNNGEACCGIKPYWQIYLLDEPTAGLHLQDVAKLLHLFDDLVAAGNSLIIVEHNLQVISQADWLIDMGPDAGIYGG